MKLKKQVKAVIILIVLGGIVFGFYSFNQWFFAKYKTKDVNVEEKKEGTSKEIFETEQSNSEEVPITEETSSSSKANVKKIRSTEIYYCSEGDTLDGKECITKIETDAIKAKKADNRDYYELIFSFDKLAMMYGVEEQEVIVIVKETCEKEIKGIFERSTTNTKQGSCIFTDMPEDNSFQYVCLDSSYTLKGDKCVKEVKIPAKIRYGCPEGFVLDGIYCQEK